MEAHPDDSVKRMGEANGEWGKVKTPKTVEERIQNAKLFFTKTKAAVPMLVDGFDDEANKLFAAWTERFYILHGNKVAYQGDDMFTYSVNETRKALDGILAGNALSGA